MSKQASEMMARYAYAIQRASTIRTKDTALRHSRPLEDKATARELERRVPVHCLRSLWLPFCECRIGKLYEHREP